MPAAGNETGRGPDRAPVASDPEEQARANLYGLISRLFCAPADPNLLAEISRAATVAAAENPAVDMVTAWSALQQACRSAYPALVRQEYDGLFIGVGRAEVTPYLSAYAVASAPDRFLVALRNQLAAWGLGRREGVFEIEDHVSGMSDIMRCLIEGGHPLAEQKKFFDAFVHPGVELFCAAVQKSPNAVFYKPVAAFALAFFELERAAFDMGDMS